MTTFNGLQVDRLVSAVQGMTGVKGAGVMPALAPELTPMVDLSDWPDNPAEQQLGWTACGGWVGAAAAAGNRSLVGLTIGPRRIVQIMDVTVDLTAVAADVVYLQVETLTGTAYVFNLGSTTSNGPMSSGTGLTTGGIALSASNDGLIGLTPAVVRNFTRFVASDTSVMRSLLPRPFTVITRDNEVCHIMVIRNTVNLAVGASFRYRWRELEPQERW